MAGYSMSSSTAKEFAYNLGVSIGIREGITPATGLQQAINWGAPFVQLEGIPSTTGFTGRQVIKEMAEANKVGLAWHIPPNQQFELAYPDESLNTQAKKMIEEGLKFAEQTGIKVINTHVTQALPRIEENEVWIYDNVSGQASRQKLSAFETEQLGKLKVKGDYKAIEKLKRDYVKKLNKERVTGFEHGVVYYEDIKESHEHSKNMIDDTYKNHVEKIVWSDPFDAKKQQFQKAAMVAAGSMQRASITLFSRFQEQVASAKTDADLREAKKTYEDIMKRAALTVQTYEDYINSTVERYGPYLREDIRGDKFKEVELPKEGRPAIEWGREKIVDNFVKQFAPLVEKAIDKGIQISIENADSRYMFSSPEEIDEVMKKLYAKLKERGIPNSKVREYVGTCFDFGHARTIAGMVINGKKMPRDVFEMAQKFPGPLKLVHAHENFGDFDAHLPLGETAPDETKKHEMAQKIQKYLKDRGVPHPAVFEIGSIGGLGYAISMQSVMPQMYMTAGGQPTWALSAPSYIGAVPTDPIHLDRRDHYFYETWVGSLF